MAKRPAVAGVVVQDEQGRYLLVQEKRPDVYGLWNWPAGHVDNGETDVEAAIREAKEETNLDVAITDINPVYDGPDRPGHDRTIRIFLAKVVDGSLKFSTHELLDARWLTLQEISDFNVTGKLRGLHIMGAINGLQARFEQ